MRLWDLCREYDTKYIDMPNRTLAKVINKEHPVFTIESARNALREIRGRMGERNRNKCHDKSRYIPLDKKLYVPCKFPTSLAEPRKNYSLPIKKGIVLFLFDAHIPYQDNNAIGLSFEYGYKYGVDLIVLAGDWLDFYQISRFNRDPEAMKVAEEINMLKEFFDIMKNNFPNAKIVFKEGNHEERYRQWWWANGKAAMGSIKSSELKDELELAERGIDYVDSYTLMTYKELTIGHGHEFFKGRSVPVNPARSLYLATGEITMAGHLHKGSEHTETSMNGKLITCWSSACLCGLWPKYSIVNKWGLGFVRMSIEEDGTWRIENKRIYKNKVF
jgi:predicted phosphodiesterase